MRKFAADERFFLNETPEAFYWAGFIAADGCVRIQNKKYKQLAIGLSILDYNHLNKFKKQIGFEGNVLNIQNKASQVVISSDVIFDSLHRFNIIPRKTKIYTFPKWICTHKHLNHFMRGYFDGDGCISKSKITKNKNIPQLRFNVLGTENFLQVYNKMIQTNCEIKKNKKLFSHNGIYRLEYGGNTIVKKIMNFMYAGSHDNIRLNRKFDKFIKFSSNIVGNNRGVSVVGTNIETGQITEFNSIEEASQTGFSRQCISACCRGLNKTHKNFYWKYKQLKT